MTSKYPPVNPQDLAIASALFGQSLEGNDKAIGLINTFGPLLMGTILFTMAQDWAVDPADPDGYAPRRNLPDARDEAHAIIEAIYDGLDQHADGGTDTELGMPDAEAP